MGKKFVITGGPGYGKTSVVEELANRGFHIVPECARKVIIEESLDGSDDLPWKDVDAFQRKVFELQVKEEKEIPKEKTTFLDRGIIDGLVYWELNNLEVPEELIEMAKEFRYDCIFLLDILPIYETDSERREDEDTARKLHGLVRKYYEMFGYNVVSVPAMSVDKRVDFIINHIAKL